MMMMMMMMMIHDDDDDDDEYLTRSTDHTANPYVVFSTPLVPGPSWAQISSSERWRENWGNHLSLSDLRRL
jgi:hypothetical protein